MYSDAAKKTDVIFTCEMRYRSCPINEQNRSLGFSIFAKQFYLMKDPVNLGYGLLLITADRAAAAECNTVMLLFTVARSVITA